ncbi:MAG: hypothetical protein D6743_03155 [Calditrichaeota bacterium]|nr:MAG: hypothetical protein D6743_03155 [Calditrichota bacterium]
MRIAEIAVVGADKRTKLEFIDAVCDELVFQTDKLIFGRLQVNPQLMIHLYGLELSDRLTPSWDLVSKKLLGYVVLFDWENQQAYEAARANVESLSERYALPLVIAAALPNGHTEVPDQLVKAAFDLSEQGQFTFYKLSDPPSIKGVLVKLLNAVLETTNRA